MHSSNKPLAAIVWGVGASIILSSTFIINSVISGSGGYWAWTASLRSVFLIPILGVVLFFTRQLRPALRNIKQYPMLFFKWGTIGFGTLYTSLALASLWAPGWLVAASFQVNILAGILLSPFIYSDHRKFIPKRALFLTLLILAGVFIMQFDKLKQLSGSGGVLLSFVFVLIGAIVWPLGNRKLLVELEHRHIKMNALQRVLGMTLGCIPLLIMLFVTGYVKAGLPSVSMCQASLFSAILSGLLGGVSFYQATQLVSKNTVALAAVEATQVLEILFTLIGEMVLKGTSLPGFYAQLGFGVIMIGLIIHFLNTWHHHKTQVKNETISMNETPVAMLN
jgi:drug/metabolite transporter (DMT)-like permease